jgi:putative acetyltransferase
LILKRTDSSNPDFRDLVKQLDEYLTIKDGDEHPFYDQFNKIENIKWVVLAYDGDHCIGCGAIKEFSEQEVEIKRMFTSPDARGKGVASAILKELENWAHELGFSECILETGTRQTEALQLYPRNGYTLISNFGPYQGVENSRCFRKIIAT